MIDYANNFNPNSRYWILFNSVSEVRAAQQLGVDGLLATPTSLTLLIQADKFQPKALQAIIARARAGLEAAKNIPDNFYLQDKVLYLKPTPFDLARLIKIWCTSMQN